MITLEFLITSLVVVLIPGTGVIYTISTGLVQGRAASVYASLGCTAGIVPHLAATILGLAAVMHTSAVAFQVLKYAGALYLLYVAWATWRDTSAFAVDGSVSRTSAWGIATKAFLLNILNPKLTIFFLAFLPQFVDASAGLPIWAQLAILGTVVNLIFTFADVVSVLLADVILARLKRSSGVQALVRKAGGTVLIGLGAHLALQKG